MNSKVLWIWTLMLSIISINVSQAKTVHEKKKTITKEVAVNMETVMSVDHDFGDIRIEKYSGTKAKIVVDITVRAEENVNLDDIIAKYKIDLSNRSEKVKVISSFGIKRWVINSGGWFTKAKNYIEFKDGTRIDAKISDLDAQLTLYIPKISKLVLDHKHHNIYSDDMDYDLNLNLFDGEYDLGNINGFFELNLKHGSGKNGNVNSANLDLFDSNIDMKEAGDILLKSRHSDLKMDNAKSMKVDLWDSEINMNTVESFFNGKEKHSKLFIDSIGSGDLEFFDSKVEIQKVGELKLNGRHSTYHFGNIISLNTDCFDCRFNIEKLNNFISSSSKHSTYHIEYLRNGITFENGFDDHIEIDATNVNFSGLDFKGEHSSIKVDMLESISYLIDVEIEHGDIDFLKDNFELTKHIEKNSKLTLLGKVNGATDNAPLIKLRGSVVNLDIKK